MLEDKLMQDYKNALKTGNVVRRNTVQQLRAAIQLAKKSNVSLTDDDIMQIIFREKNKRTDALAQFEAANRQDLIEQTNKELMVVNEYLPQPISEFDLLNEVKAFITSENITDGKMMGYVMGKMKEKFGLRATGKQINEAVKKALGI